MSESKPVLLQIEGLPAEIEAQLAAIYSVHRIGADALADAPAPSVAVAEAVVTGGGTGLPRAWIEAMPALRIIAINGVGTDRVDLGFARARGIDVTTTPGALTDAVAELALGLTLAVMRRIVTGDAFVRAGQWAARAPFPLGGGLRGRRLGILGLGQIGLATGRLAEAFGMRVRYWNRTPRSNVGWTALPDPVALAADSDVLVIAAAATPATEGLVDAAVLRALGPAGVLVNVARGSVVNEDALLEALAAGTIAGAGLDVFVGEPSIRPAFLQAQNVVLLPHVGSATVEARRTMGEIILSNLEAVRLGKRPPTVVN